MGKQDRQGKTTKRKSRWIRDLKHRFNSTGVAFKAVIGTLIFLAVGAVCLIVGFGCSMGFGKLFNNIRNFIAGPSGLYWVVLIAILVLFLGVMAIVLWVKDTNKRKGE